MAFTIAIGTRAPGFSLPGVDGKTYTLESFKTPLLVVCFTCNHCPYVIGNESRERAFVETYGPKGVGYVAINANETKEHPTDDLAHMVARAKERRFTWPYLRDETQEVAKAYGATRTPHFYLFDQQRVLRYTGRMDNSPREIARATTHELQDAVEDLLAGRAVRVEKADAIGCNVKWWGKDAHWMPNDACDFV